MPQGASRPCDHAKKAALANSSSRTVRRSMVGSRLRPDAHFGTAHGLHAASSVHPQRAVFNGAVRRAGGAVAEDDRAVQQGVTRVEARMERCNAESLEGLN